MQRSLKIAGYVLLLTVLLIAALIGGNWKSDIPLGKLTKKYANAHSQFINIHSMPVHFRQEGNITDCTPVVLLHGTASSLHTWDSIMPALKEAYRVIRLDLPGFGLTGPMYNNNYSVDSYVDFLKTFLDSLDVNHCVLAGNSLGGHIAWKFAVKYPQQVKSLIILDGGGMPVSNQYLPLSFKIARMPFLGDFLEHVTPKFLITKSVRRFYGDPARVNDALLERYYELMLREGNRMAMINRVRQLKADNDYGGLNTLDIPALIIWGEKDLVYPLEAGYLFHQLLPNSKLVVLKNTGHLPMEENPQETIEHMMSFLAWE